MSNRRKLISLVILSFFCYGKIYSQNSVTEKTTQKSSQTYSLDESLNGMNIYVSPNGNDNWSGELAEPDKNRTDGPLASLEEAQRRIIQLKGISPYPKKIHSKEGGFSQMIVWIREGTYRLNKPLVFTADHSGPVIFAAYPDEKPVISGGRPVEGWKTETLNGKMVWVKNLPEVAGGNWYFRSLFVNGKRAVRARLPKEGFFRVEDPLLPADKLAYMHNYPCSTFIAKQGDLKNWPGIGDAEIVLLHTWIEERLPVASFDPKTRMVTTKRIARKAFVEAHPAHGGGNAPYYIENLFEALTEPGEWYLNHKTGNLYYIPRPGETPENTTVIAPVTKQLLKITGVPGENRFVENLRFKGLTFTETDWCQPGDPGDENNKARWSSEIGKYYGSASQAAADLPGVIYLEGARYCGFENCRFTNLGWYGVEIADGCRGIRFVNNEIFDTGGGGIKINGSKGTGPASLETGSNQITDNHIHSGGRIFQSAVGILLMCSGYNLVAHNSIHDFYYTGISVGWAWHYTEKNIRENRILNNHIYDIGQGWLSDMGGIYTLGTQPGTVIKGNLIHDINAAVYGAACIYLDESTSFVVVEDNLCFRTNRDIAELKGRENMIRNNIFAFGERGIIKLVDEEIGVNTFTFQNNILMTDGVPVFHAGYFKKLENRTFRSDLNLIWDIGKKPVIVENMLPGKNSNIQFPFEWWQNDNLQDRHSLIEDPGCVNWKNDDFSLPENSPALKVGFVPFDIKHAGVRNPDDQNQDNLKKAAPEVKPQGHIQ